MNSTQRLLETVADIAYLAGASRHYSGDSREDLQQYITWAEAFERLRVVQGGDETYNGQPYMEAIEIFMQDKLPKHDESCPVCSANVHGRAKVALDLLSQNKLPQLRRELLVLRNFCRPAYRLATTPLQKTR